MPLRMPVTASFPNGPALNSRGIAVCNGPDIDGIGRGCASAGAAVGVPLAEPELVVDSVLGAVLCCAEEVSAAGAVPSEVFESAVEGVCARAGHTGTQLNKKAAKHFENTVIPISPSRAAFGRTTLPSLGGRLYALLFRNANGK